MRILLFILFAANFNCLLTAYLDGNYIGLFFSLLICLNHFFNTKIKPILNLNLNLLEFCCFMFLVNLSLLIK